MQRTWIDVSLKRFKMANKDMERCSISLFIREMKIKTTMRYYFTHTKMAIIF